MYMSHLDNGHNGKWDEYIPEKQFCLIALLGWFSIVWPLISWVPLFSNTVNTQVENEDG